MENTSREALMLQLQNEYWGLLLMSAFIEKQYLHLLEMSNRDTQS